MLELSDLSKELKATTKRLSELTELFKKHSNQLRLEELEELAVYAEYSRAQAKLLAHLLSNIIDTHLPY